MGVTAKGTAAAVAEPLASASDGAGTMSSARRRSRSWAQTRCRAPRSHCVAAVLVAMALATAGLVSAGNPRCVEAMVI